MLINYFVREGCASARQLKKNSCTKPMWEWTRWAAGSDREAVSPCVSWSGFRDLMMMHCSRRTVVVQLRRSCASRGGPQWVHQPPAKYPRATPRGGDARGMSPFKKACFSNVELIRWQYCCRFETLVPPACSDRITACSHDAPRSGVQREGGAAEKGLSFPMSVYPAF